MMQKKGSDSLKKTRRSPGFFLLPTSVAAGRCDTSLLPVCRYLSAVHEQRAVDGHDRLGWNEVFRHCVKALNAVPA